MTASLSPPSGSPSDDPGTLASLGLLAYVLADIVHHALGHGVACLAVGGRIVSLSAIFVDCTRRGPMIDGAGPLANLVAGLACLLVLAVARRPALRLFLALAAAQNLLWFGGNVLFSVITMRDDWAFVIAGLAPAWAWRIASGALGIAAYVAGVRLLAWALQPFLEPPPVAAGRVGRIALLAYAGAGLAACATALLDPHGWPAFAQHAGPQSLMLGLGLLAAPRIVRRRAGPGTPAPRLVRDAGWIAAAIVALVVSIALFGPGFAVPF